MKPRRRTRTGPNPHRRDEKKHHAPPSAPASNRFLAALPARDRARLIANSDQVHLRLGDVFNEPGDVLRHAYFP